MKLNKLGNWRKLEYWKSGEWQVIEEKLNDDPSAICPPRDKLFLALEQTPPEKTKVAIIGQDPYPDGLSATGVAFSIPEGQTKFPPTLDNIFAEYCSDLGHLRPISGSLERWCQQGVLLWNAIPSCAVGKPASHRWDEWSYLTKEIVEKLDGQVVFVFLGRIARGYSRYVRSSPVVETSHPSRLGAKHGFLGSKLFTLVNTKLVEFGKEPIDWKL